MTPDKRTTATLNDLRAAFDSAMVRNPGGAYPTRLPIELYDRAKAEGFNMTGYAYALPQEQTVYIPSVLWDRANAEGLDLNGFEKQEMIVIDHRMPTSAQMRERLLEKVAKGERLGSSHNLGPRHHPVRGSITRKGNPR